MMKRSRIQADDFTIGWICALPVELSAATVVLDEEYSAPSDTVQYVLGRVGIHNVVLAALPAGQYGTNSAAVTATELRSKFPSIQNWLMVGIGGGVPSSDIDIRLGDVVISRPQNQHGGVIQYDLGKTNQDGQRVRTGSLNAPPAVLGTAVSRMQSSRNLGRSRIKTHLSAFSHLAEFQRPEAATDVLFHSDRHLNEQPCILQVVDRPVRLAKAPIVHFGLIASGNQVIKDGETRDRLSAELGGVLCFEMEAAGLMNNFPCLVIRGICNYADSHKNKRWQSFAAASAAACAKEILSFVSSVARAEADGDNAIGHEAATNTCSLQLGSITEPMFVKTSLNDELRQQYLASLSFDTINSRHATIRSAHSKTCTWITDTSEYRSWLSDQDLSGHHGFFWIKGKPGVGKSTMMKYLLAKTIKDHQDAKVVSFFFNARGEDLEKTTRGMYQSILLQILEKFPEIQDVVALCPPKAISLDCFEWDVDSLKTVLGHAIMRIRDTPLLVFIDALDECDENEVRDMIELFEHLGDMATTNGIRFRTCFSSRHYPSVTIDGSVELTLEDREGHQLDIEEYLRTELKAGRSKFVNRIREEVLHRASGIFLWVVLVVRILNTEFIRGNKHAMRRKLDELPDDLERLFEDILLRDNQNIGQLKLCLQWLLFSARSLKIEELYFAILAGGEPDLIPRWDFEEMEESLEDARRFVLNTSKGLVEETKSKNSKPRTVQFIHETVRDFFLKGNGLKNPIFGHGEDFEARAHDQLKHCCQNYFTRIDMGELVDMHEDIPKASSDAGKELRDEADRLFPFLRYAVQYALHHSENAEALGVSQEKFVQEFELGQWRQLNNLLEPREIRRYTPAVELLYILAEKNLPCLIKLGFKRAGGLECRGGRHGFPLAAASYSGNEAAVRALLICYLGDRTDVPRQDLESAVSSLLDKPPPCRKIDTILPLWIARPANEKILEIVCFSERSSGATGDPSESRLTLESMKSPHTKILNLLSRYASKASTIDLEDEDAPNPSLPSTKHVDQFLGLFPEDNMDVTKMNVNFHTAVKLDFLAVARLLLSYGAQIDAKNANGLTVLHEACYDFNLRQSFVRSAAVRLLLESGARVDIKDIHGETALHRACKTSREDLTVTVDLLVKYGANIHDRDHAGNTALHTAAKSHPQTVKFVENLLRHGADVNARNKHAQAPLQILCHSPGTYDSTMLLLKAGAKFNSEDENGNTALHDACSRLNYVAIATLLRYGASVNVKNKKGETAVHKLLAANPYYRVVTHMEAMVKLFLTNGADVYATDNSGRTALSISSNDHTAEGVAITKVLEDHIAKLELQRAEFPGLLALRNSDAVVEEDDIDESDSLCHENQNTANGDQERDQVQEEAEIQTDEAE